MDRKMAALIAFLLLFLIIFIIDYFFIKRKYLKRKKKNSKNNELTEIAYLIGKFKLNKSKLNLNSVLLVTSFINSFIISLVIVVVLMININPILQLLIGFILLIALIYSMYEIYGNYLVRKENDNNE